MGVWNENAHDNMKAFDVEKTRRKMEAKKL